MWMFLLIVSLLDQNQASPTAGARGDAVQLIPQQEPVPITPSTTTAINQQTGSSSSSSSSSASSESSQSSEGLQQVRERQNQETMALEEMDSSQESRRNKSADPWLNEPALVREGLDEQQRHAGDDSVESQHQALLLNLHHLLGQPETKEIIPTKEVGGETTYVSENALDGGGVGADIVDAQLLPLDSMERENELTFDTPYHYHYHGHRGEEAALELGL
nr:uncharacterized protein LOC122766234 [Solea senegalensis]